MVEVAPTTQATEAAKPPKASKVSKADAAKAEKEALKLANTLANQQLEARRAANKLMLKPILKEYFKSLALLQEIVEVDGVKCYRPLARGVHKTMIAHVRSLPEVKDCSNTLLLDLIKARIAAHVKKPEYHNGVLKFTNRFDLERNESGTILETEKERAQKILSTLRKKKKNKA